MLDDRTITELAGNVARRVLAHGTVERILTEPTTDSVGEDALRITLVMEPDSVPRITGDEAGDLIAGIQRTLHEAGEKRFPIIRYATEQELAMDDEDDDVEQDRETPRLGGP